MSVAYIGVASNVRPKPNIKRGLSLLASRARITGISSFYETRRDEQTEQPAFVNGVVRIETSVKARALKFDILRSIESALKRKRSANKNDARTLDLDLLLFDNLVVREDELELPARDIRSQWFVALPLLEIDAGLVLPDTGERLEDAAKAVTAQVKERPLTRFSNSLRRDFLQPEPPPRPLFREFRDPFLEF